MSNHWLNKAKTDFIKQNNLNKSRYDYFMQRDNSMDIRDNLMPIVLSYENEYTVEEMPILRVNYMECQSDFSMYLCEVDSISTLVKRLIRIKTQITSIDNEMEKGNGKSDS